VLAVDSWASRLSPEGEAEKTFPTRRALQIAVMFVSFLCFFLVVALRSREPDRMMLWCDVCFRLATV